MSAAQVNDQLLRKDPEGPGRRETRRKIVDLYVRCGDAHRSSAIYRQIPRDATFELRYRAAERIARDLLQADKGEPRDHRLLAMALEGLAVPGNREAWTSRSRVRGGPEGRPRRPRGRRAAGPPLQGTAERPGPGPAGPRRPDPGPGPIRSRSA